MTQRANARILVVDDDADTLSNLSDILIEHGFEVQVASSSQAALAAAGEPRTDLPCPFDLCLLDFRMPEMDGARFLEKLRTVCPNLPAIMITAYAADEGIQRALDAGTRAVLRKPLDVQMLLNAIGEVLAQISR